MSRRVSSFSFFFALAVGLPLLPAPLAAQEDPEAKTRAGLLAQIAQNKPKEVAKSLKARDGEYIDLLLSATAEDPAALVAARPILEHLPEIERKGATELIDALIAATPETRKAFSLAFGSIRSFERRALEMSIKPEERASELATIEARAKAASSAYLAARGIVADAAAEPDAPKGARRVELVAARDELARLGDRRRQAIANAVAAQALIETFKGDEALKLRDASKELLAACGASTAKGPLTEWFAALDLALAEALLDCGRPAAADAAAARAKGALRSTDARRAFRLLIATADARLESAGAAAAVDAVKPLMATLTKTEDAATLVAGARLVGRVYRGINKSGDAVKFLTLCRARAAGVGASLADESALAYFLAQAYAGEGKDEAASAAFGASSELATKGGAPYLARIALGGRAAMLALRGKDEDASKALEAALNKSAGGPTLDRLTSATLKLAFGEAALDAKRMKEAASWTAEASAVCEILGCTHESLPGRDEVLNKDTGASVGDRFFSTLRELDVGKDFAKFEPIFAAVERRRFTEIAKVLPDETPADPAFLRDVLESKHRLARFTRAMMVGRPQPSEEEATRLFTQRKGLRDAAVSQSGAFVMKHFPEIASIKRARAVVCGPRGAMFGAMIGDEGGFAFAFTAESFLHRVIPGTVKIKELCETFAKVANDPNATPEAFVAASGPVWNELIKPLLPVLEQKTRVAVYLEPTLDSFPFEALVPPEAQGGFDALPYLVTKIGVGRLPTASLTRTPRTEARGYRWLSNRRLSGFAPAGVDALLGTAKMFDEKYQPPETPSESVALWTDSARAPERTAPGGVFILGPGAATTHAAWRSSLAPEALALFDPPASPKDGNVALLRLVASGPKAVFAPVEKLDPVFVEAMTARICGLMVQQGTGPIEALAEAQRAVINNGMTPGGKPLKPEWKKPAVWGRYRVYVVAP
jgi:hypothetical protein